LPLHAGNDKQRLFQTKGDPQGDPMNFFVVSMVVLVLSVASYQFAAKFIPHTLSTWHVLTIVYLMGVVLSIVMGFIDSSNKQTLWQTLRSSNWAVFVLGFAVVETGYLLAFRAGWKLNITGVFSNAAAAILLFPIGIWILKERMTTLNIAGLIIALIGLFLIVRR
jgi:drug/metabolite transporter (DMT)-like permease